MPTFTVRPGIYLTPTGDPATATQRWHRDGVEIVGASGTSYTTASPADDGKLIEYVENVANLAGSAAEQRLTLQAALSQSSYTAAFSNSFVSVGDAFPEAARTRSCTFAMRLIGNIGKSDPPATMGNLITGGFIGLQNMHWVDGDAARLLLDSALYGVSFATSGNTVRELVASLLITVDFDQNLSGGKTVSVYGSLDGAAATELASTTGFTGSGADKPYLANLGSRFSGSTDDGTFSLNGWLWADNTVVVDPAQSWSAFFNQNGTVKELAFDGTVSVTDAAGLPQTVSPRLFIAGADWGSTGATIPNRGTGADLARADDPVTVAIS